MKFETNLNAHVEEDSVFTDQDLPPAKLPMYILFIGVIRMLMTLGLTLAAISSMLTQITMLTFSVNGFAQGLGNLIGIVLLGLIFMYLYPQSILEINRSLRVWNKRRFRVYTMIVMGFFILAICFAVFNNIIHKGDYGIAIVFLFVMLLNIGIVVFDGYIIYKLRGNRSRNS
ncbi:MAG: hypothetical protein KA198_07715 [Chitinophagaceae bacterium]|nr:hypothetical protein [Chitinophagaceae bacterium]